MTNCTFILDEETRIDYPLTELPIVQRYDGKSALEIKLNRQMTNEAIKYSITCGHVQEKVLLKYPNSKYRTKELKVKMRRVCRLKLM